MTEIIIKLTAADTERLYAIKELQGLDNLTGREFAQRLLIRNLHRLFPATPKRDEEGHLINAGNYRG